MEENGTEMLHPKYYNYKAKEKLLLYCPDEMTSYENVFMVPYKVNNSYMSPFLNILLHKQKNADVLQLPEIQMIKQFTENELVNWSKIILFKLLLLSDYEQFSENVVFDGYYVYENSLYLFFDITQCEPAVNDVYKYTPCRFALIDEIVNHENVCNIVIDTEVIELFHLNDDLCFLTDENDEIYETPITAYTGSPKTHVNFRYVFGEPCQNRNAILGPFFYFTSLGNALNTEGADCIIRFALFTGSMKYCENSVSDPDDNSDIKMERLQDPNLSTKLEGLTIRITDHDGEWSKTYDSIYLGEVELDDGNYMKGAPFIAIKTYEQQVPLSYHYIDKKLLNEGEKYLIL